MNGYSYIEMKKVIKRLGKNIKFILQPSLIHLIKIKARN